MENNGNIAEIKRICDLYNENKFFEIPPYQRLYEWSNDEINELLNDMKEAWRPSILSNSNVGENEQKSSKSYFIGTVTISVKTNEKEQDKENNDKNKVYRLIDGQQRLTTLWFIGFYLASNEKCGEWQKKWQKFIIQGENLRIVMPIRDSEENALKELTKKIIDGKYKFKQDKDNKIATFKESSNIHQKIIEAFSCIESWFMNGNGKNIDLANFAKYIYEKVCFVFVTLAENTDLNRFFVRMNNRGKQLEKHEILKARLLNAIRESYKNEPNKKDEWQQYAKIWDLCSDMDKYIFQSASNRSILKSKSQNENSAESSNNNDSLVKIADIVEKYKIPEANKSKEKDSPSKVESIIDFPTFLLHCYKLWVAKKCNNKEILQKISITKNNLLEIMWDNQIVKGKNKELIIDDNFTFDSKSNAKQNCKEFIIDMLRYRVLFDYFVIKNTLGDDGFAIMRFYESNGSYRPKAKSFENLTMIQNYLRVARQGEKQNYEHWLTEFLEFLSSDNLQFDEIKEIKEFVDNFLSNKDKNELPKSLVKKESQKDEPLTEKLKVLQEKLVGHLEKIDAEQIRNVNLKEHYKQNGNFIIDESFLIKYLSNGVKTPHYWFYRLEYYLWKWGSQKDKINNDKIKNIFAKFDSLEFPNGEKFNFEKILSAFYFRNLNSVEHFHPQHLKKQNGWETYIDYFGNLALISSSTNSQYSDQLPKDKKEDLKNKLNKKGSNIESLKFFLMCAQCEQDKNEWVYDNNVKDKHEKQMIDILIKTLGISKENQ